MLTYADTAGEIDPGGNFFEPQRYTIGRRERSAGRPPAKSPK